MPKHGPARASTPKGIAVKEIAAKVMAAKAGAARDGANKEGMPTERAPRDNGAKASPPPEVVLRESPEVEQHGRFKTCAETHGVRLHRIHVLSATKLGSFQSTLVFDCICGQRWLLRVMQGDVVSVDTGILEELRRGREGQPTAPPGHPGAPVPAPPPTSRKSR